ncbi:hypothetical protein [Clostridium magnum]|uniref:hypothetical protein n=1 Tax=Clostridium magnum TaxID=33954 RepID=UPI0009182E15|nr:hypothetical protein [Clostridium magnum]SHJ14391.1 hypothetical protein SAMN02745944_05439 [Clostridium magnum DSM 2767]
MDVNKQAEQAVKVAEFKEAIRCMVDYLPEIAKFSLQVYEEYRKVGFNDTQAFNFTKDYIIAMSFKNK